jgi:hypothetical protein
MEALAMCARNNISCRNADIYVTTFPCHNCTKHLVAAGIKEVVYIEAYPKSRSFELFSDSISDVNKKEEGKVLFRPFFGVGPRKFIEMFSMDFGTLPLKKRKYKEEDEKNGDGKAGNAIEFKAEVRDKMSRRSYLERELVAANNVAIKINRYFAELEGK